jgi:dATP pyrophosphohydrolase
MRRDLPIICRSIAAFVCHRSRHGTKFLLLQRQVSRGGFWQPVSGGIEQGESAAQAAIREIREETSLDIQEMYSADQLEMFYHVGKDCIRIAPVFVAFVTSAEPVKLCREHSDHKWVGLHGAMELLAFEEQRRLLKYVRDNFVRRPPEPRLRVALGERDDRSSQ